MLRLFKSTMIRLPVCVACCADVFSRLSAVYRKENCAVNT